MADVKKFLDQGGVSTLWSKVKEELAKKEAAGAAAAVETAINTKLGTVPSGSTVMAEIQKAQEAATYDDAEVRGLINTLVGTDADKSVRTIANEELAAQLIPENAAEALNTLQEIAAWIQSHPDDASAMNDKIAALQTAVGKPASEGVAATGLYLTDSQNAAEIARVAGLVEALGTLASKDTIKDGDVAADAAIAMSKISGLADALAGKQDTIPANTYDPYGAATTAETNAKAYADGLFGNVQALTTAEIEAAIAAATAQA